MDVNAVLLGVQERDKWRSRLRLLETTLADVRDRRRRLAGRLRKIKRDLARLGDFSEAVLDPARRANMGGRIGAAQDGRITPR